MVAEIGFASSEEAWDGGLQLVVHPKATHRVVDGRIYHHRHLVGVVVGDFLVHLEEVAILLLHNIAPKAVDSVSKVEVDSQSRGAYAIARVAAFLGGSAGHIAWHEVAESGVAALKVVVAVFLGDVERAFLAATDGFGIFFLLGHPYAAVVAEALAHEGELRLVVAMHGDTCGVNLHIAGVGEGSTAAMAHPCGRAITVHSVGAEVIDIAIAARAKHHGMSCIAFQLASGEVADNNAAGASLFHYEIHHLCALVQHYGATGYFATQSSVSTQQQLLPRLPTGVECSGDLCAAEGAVVEQSAVIARKGYSLRHALVNNVAADLCQAVDVGLASAVVASLDGIFEEAFHAVAIVLVVFGGIDASLRGDGVCATGGILNAEDVHMEA